jgi:L-2-hydroxyglutarate oxidase
MAFASDIQAAGGTIQLGAEVTRLVGGNGRTTVETSVGPFAADIFVNCSGLQSDRVAALDGVANEARIVPFRGEYFQLRPGREFLVRGLIYPVPDPDFPFLGVHLTRMVDGSVHAGPNAVLALAREGYSWRSVRGRDVLSTLAFPGFWRLARSNVVEGSREVLRSLSRHRFADSLARLVPALSADDLEPTDSGVRAQALRRDGRLVDDFLIERRGRNVHVLNAPSPAATSALEIGRYIAERAVASA